MENRKKPKKKSFVRLKVELANLLAEKAWQERAKKFVTDADSFFYFHGCHPGTDSWRDEALAFGQSWWDDWLRELAGVCDEVWKEQRAGKKTPLFFKDVLKRVIMPHIEKASDFMADFFAAAARRATTPSPPLSDQEWRPHKEELIYDWELKTKIEIAKLKSRARRAPRSKPPGNPERAKDMGRMVEELEALESLKAKGSSEYEALRSARPNFLIFRLADKHPELQDEVRRARGYNKHLKVARMLLMADTGLEEETLRIDWKNWKPERFRAIPD